MDQMTQAVLAFQRTGKLDPKVKDQIMELIYFYPSRRLGLPEEMQADFYFFLEPKIGRMLRAFEYQEVPFRGYLTSCLYWQSRSFLRKMGREERLSAAMELGAQDLPYEEDFSMTILKDLENELRVDQKLSKAEQKRLIVIATKYIYYLRQDEMQILVKKNRPGSWFLGRTTENRRGDL
jgi:hypothetical protein